MDKHSEQKDKITELINKLRIHLSQIILSYEKLYGTTELLDSYDEFLEED